MAFRYFSPIAPMLPIGVSRVSTRLSEDAGSQGARTHMDGAFSYSLPMAATVK
jgi:hypothetical protein